jgi:two-component system sensor histidine kinase KdpD
VDADPALLERVIANVVSNALAWTAPGTRVCVAVDTRPDRVELRIIDHGPGVVVEDRERLFEPFQRLGDRSNDSGAGLGLAVARGFVEAMGGRIRMEDTCGGGQTMEIDLRAAG